MHTDPNKHTTVDQSAYVHVCVCSFVHFKTGRRVRTGRNNRSVHTETNPITRVVLNLDLWRSSHVNQQADFMCLFDSLVSLHLQ